MSKLFTPSYFLISPANCVVLLLHGDFLNPAGAIVLGTANRARSSGVFTMSSDGDRRMEKKLDKKIPP